MLTHSLSISVIIPNWNRAQLLAKAITSALRQTVPVLEVLACDDGSGDDSESTVKAITDPRVVWLPGPRGGRPAIPRNRGIRAARGEWIAFLDNDDEWLPDKLEKQLVFAQKHRLQAVCTNAHRLLPQQGVVGTSLSWKAELIFFNDLLACNQVICSSLIVKKTLFDTVGVFPEEATLNVGEDYALWLRMATQGPIGYLAEPLTIYRDDPKASIRQYGADSELQRWFVMSNFIRWARHARRTGSTTPSAICLTRAWLRMVVARWNSIYYRAKRGR